MSQNQSMSVVLEAEVLTDRSRQTGRRVLGRAPMIRAYHQRRGQPIAEDESPNSQNW